MLLGYLTVTYIVILAIKQCKSESTKIPSLLKTNETADADPEIVNHGDVFVPYQGESFSVFDWTLFRVIKSSSFNYISIVQLTYFYFDNIQFPLS